MAHKRGSGRVLIGRFKSFCLFECYIQWVVVAQGHWVVRVFRLESYWQGAHERGGNDMLLPSGYIVYRHFGQLIIRHGLYLV